MGGVLIAVAVTNRDQHGGGDFNVPGTSWSTDEKSIVSLRLAHQDFTEGSLDMSLSQGKYYNFTRPFTGTVFCI